MGFILVYVTNEDLKHAKKLAKSLLEKNLIACANFFPIEAMHKWKGKVVEEEEVVSIFKAKAGNWMPLKVEITKLHTYEVPCIIKIDVSANLPFEEWVKKEC